VVRDTIDAHRGGSANADPSVGAGAETDGTNEAASVGTPSQSGVPVVSTPAVAVTPPAAAAAAAAATAAAGVPLAALYAGISQAARKNCQAALPPLHYAVAMQFAGRWVLTEEQGLELQNAMATCR
jgi:hypothetical protein